MSYFNKFNSNSGDPQDSYERRISYLKTEKKFNTKPIEDGIASSVENLQRKEKSFVIYGEPQSGKTEVMIALTCKLVDLDFKTIFIVMNDNTELEEQNFERFLACQQLNPSPVRQFDIAAMEEYQRKQEQTRIIFCRKNAVNLRNLIRDVRFMGKRVVIDDEADYASPDNKIKKENDQSKINELLAELLNLDADEESQGVYIGVTATPARLDLNNTFLNKSERWVFLGSHKEYIGREFFFPITEKQREKGQYQLKLLPDTGDIPKYLDEAVLRFILRVAFLNFNKKEHKSYSMLIHTDGKMNSHKEDQKQLNKLITTLVGKDNESKEKIFTKLENLAEEMIGLEEFTTPSESVIQFIYKQISRNSILVINSKGDRGNVKRACEPKALFTFCIGGNIVSRGLTFSNLLSFFFSRGVKGKMTHNTYIQRARMFGTRGYSKHFELAIPKSLYEQWFECFTEHEESLRYLKSFGKYIHISGRKTQVTDSASIDPENIRYSSGEMEVGEIFSLNSSLEAIITDGTKPSVQRLRELISSSPDTKMFGFGLLDWIEQLTETHRLGLVLTAEKEIWNIERYKNQDGTDIVNLRRARGGLVGGLIRESRYTDCTHFVMPIKNSKGDCRFIYRSVQGKRLIENMIRR